MFRKFLNLNFDLPKFGTGGGINRHKYIIIFVIFLFSINIKSFGEITLEDPGTPKSISGEQYYELSTPGHLYWFADQVNSGEISINAILTQDIEVISSTDTKAYEGLQSLLEGKEITNEEQKTDLKKLEWTPIGNKSKPYTGNFNGNGKTISGLYFNDTSKNFVGLFGYVKNGVIENIGVKNSYFKANDFVGGLIGNFYVYKGMGEVTSSYSSGCTVEGGSSASVGGLIGWFYVEGGGKGAVTSSYSSGCTVEGGANVGGLIGEFYVGEVGTGEVRSSYSSGCTVEGTGDGAKVGGLIGRFYVYKGKGEVTSSYSSGCTVEGGSGAYVGGLIGYFYIYSGGTGAVTSSYSSGCTVEGGTSASVGGLIGRFYVAGGGTGAVTSNYSSGCTVEGGTSASVGGLIGWFYVEGTGAVTSSYSSGCTVEGGSGAYVGGLIGWFYVKSGGTGAVTKCFYLETQASNGVGAQGGVATPDVTKVTDAEFKGESNILTNKTVLAILNEGVIDSRVKKIERDYKNDVAGLVNDINSKLGAGYTDQSKLAEIIGNESTLKDLAEKLIEEEKTNFKKDSGDDGSNYPVHTWSNRVAYVVGSGDQTEVIKREYVHPVDNYKLTQKIKINNFEAKFDWVTTQDDLSYKVTEVKVVENKSVTVFAYNTKSLKIPVRVKINYDPSNKLETLVSKNFKHEFFRKIDDGGWKTMLEEKQYLYDVSPVSGSIKINPDGSKTQDFIFNYYIYQAKDRNGKAYQFGFNKKYPVKTYLREDVGGGKKLYIDYGVWGRE